MKIVTPVTGKTSSCVKISTHSELKINKTPIHSNQMVSLNIVSLFLRVPTEEILTVVRDKLAADHSLEERTYN